MRGSSRRDTPKEFGVGLPHDTERPDLITSSDAYARSRFRGAVGRWLLDEQTRAVGALLDRLGEGTLRVLDLGGGHGQVAPLLAERGHHVVVHGSTDRCFARIAPLRQAHRCRVSACASTLWQLPFADRTFDLVIAVRVFGHVTRWQELAGEMARVANRHVIIEFARAQPTLLTVFPGLSDVVFDLKRWFEGTTRPFFAYREEALAELLTARQFRPVAVEAQFALPMVLHRMGRNPRISAALESALRTMGVGHRLRSPALLLAERLDGSENGRRDR